MGGRGSKKAEEPVDHPVDREDPDSASTNPDTEEKVETFFEAADG